MAIIHKTGNYKSLCFRKRKYLFVPFCTPRSTMRTTHGLVHDLTTLFDCKPQLKGSFSLNCQFSTRSSTKCFFKFYLLSCNLITYFLSFQNLKNQIMTTNLWVEQVCFLLTTNTTLNCNSETMWLHL